MFWKKILPLFLVVLSLNVSALQITVHPSASSVILGQSVTFTVMITERGNPIPDCLVLTYVNGHRWGAHERTGKDGTVQLHLPFPHAGTARVQVQAIPTRGDGFWIWGEETKENQNVTLYRTFDLPRQPKRVKLRVAVDDSCSIYINGNQIGHVTSWTNPPVFTDIASYFRSGQNTITLKAHNGTGPAGVALVLEAVVGKKTIHITTDPKWKVHTDTDKSVHVIGPVSTTSPWIDNLTREWPGVIPRKWLFAGNPLPENAVVSSPVSITVKARKFHVPFDPEHIIGIQWEPWFTPRNPYWQTAQAVPIVGFYDSTNKDVIRQHAFWLMDMGINFILVDWSNHIWGKQHWSERSAGADEIIHATTVTLEEYARMRDEGYPVPKVVIMPGLSNGPPTTMTALNEELEWIYEHYISRSDFHDLWLLYEGKPLVVPLDCAYLVARGKTEKSVDSRHFTIRWMGTQLQLNHRDKDGYWSWMDGCLRPIVTYHNGKPEVVTPTPAYFGDGGWLYPQARGRRGGTTLIESFNVALETRPQFVLLHQFNEFAGQPEGHGYGKKHDIYVDSYSVELSDDLEPVSLTARGYRGDKGGWGFYYLNLSRALIDLFRHPEKNLTVLAVWPPERHSCISDTTMDVGWTWAGKKPKSFTILLDGATVARELTGKKTTIDISNLSKGNHDLSVVAEGAYSRFVLSYTQEDIPLKSPVPCSVTIPFVKQ